MKVEVTPLTEMHSERARGSGTSCFKGNAIWIQEENYLPREVMESPLLKINSQDSV